MLQSDTIDHVHHMLVYKCHDFVNMSAANSSDVCSNVHAEAIFCRTNLLIGGWAIGAGVRILLTFYNLLYGVCLLYIAIRLYWILFIHNI